ncbi:MAG: hypothetical protein K2K12_06375, partial [Clostridia bacterium]|nr:hypothetical protein [Clostridia bacterium]
GNIVCGENEPSVALDYSVREVSGQTIYQFVIKNGIKFSDGVDLTIDDVLFNLYVYLDYAYTGSATIYSTRIVGLNEYRTNDPNATEDSAAAWDEKFQADADLHVKNLISYVKHYGCMLGDKPSAPVGYEKEEAEEDFKRASETFRKELSDDYNSILGSMESYKENYQFTAAWQPFLAQEVGDDFYQRKTEGGPLIKDENGNPQFDPDKAQGYENRLAAYIEEHKDDEGYNYDEAVKAWAVGVAFDSYIGESIEETYGDDFETVLTYFATASTIRDYFKTVAANEQFSGNRVVNSISGIEAKKANEFVASSVSNATSYTGDYNMLQIKVNGVDPKAIYNFSFVVAPRHYYGDETYVNAKTGVGVNEFGVSPGDADFMDKVVKAEEKNATPVGAGSYMATNSSGADLYNHETGEIKGGFINNSIVYYKRNENFHTVGAG